MGADRTAGNLRTGGGRGIAVRNGPPPVGVPARSARIDAGRHRHIVNDRPPRRRAHVEPRRLPAAQPRHRHPLEHPYRVSRERCSGAHPTRPADSTARTGAAFARHRGADRPAAVPTFPAIDRHDIPGTDADGLVGRHGSDSAAAPAHPHDVRVLHASSGEFIARPQPQPTALTTAPAHPGADRDDPTDPGTADGPNTDAFGPSALSRDVTYGWPAESIRVVTGRGERRREAAGLRCGGPCPGAGGLPSGCLQRLGRPRLRPTEDNQPACQPITVR